MPSWLYRFNENENYPEPLEEIAALAAINLDGDTVHLMLNRHVNSPMCRAEAGDLIYLCTPQQHNLVVHGTATVAEKPFQGDTPEIVADLYGHQPDHFFCPISNILLEAANQFGPAVLPLANQQAFLKGQATARRLDHEANAPLHGSKCPQLKR